MFEPSFMSAVAFVTSILGLAFFALAVETHWQQAQGNKPLTKSIQLLLRGFGALNLAISLLLCLAGNHATMAALVWIMLLAVAALTIAFTLTWCSRWLTPLVAWLPQSARQSVNK